MGIEIPDEMDGSTLKPFCSAKSLKLEKSYNVRRLILVTQLNQLYGSLNLAFRLMNVISPVLRSGRHRIVNFAK